MYNPVEIITLILSFFNTIVLIKVYFDLRPVGPKSTNRQKVLDAIIIATFGGIILFVLIGDFTPVGIIPGRAFQKALRAAARLGTMVASRSPIGPGVALSLALFGAENVENGYLSNNIIRYPFPYITQGMHDALEEQRQPDANIRGSRRNVIEDCVRRSPIGFRGHAPAGADDIPPAQVHLNTVNTH